MDRCAPYIQSTRLKRAGGRREDRVSDTFHIGAGALNQAVDLVRRRSTTA